MNWINTPSKIVSPKGVCVVVICTGIDKSPCWSLSPEPCSRKAHTR